MIRYKVDVKYSKQDTGRDGCYGATWTGLSRKDAATLVERNLVVNGQQLSLPESITISRERIDDAI